jgi:hypothetical protein
VEPCGGCRLDAGAAGPWRAEIKASGVESGYGSADEVSILAQGQASDLASPAARAASFRAEGSADGLAPADPELAQAVGPSVRFTATGDWASGQPVTVETVQAILSGATASFAGTANAAELNGRFGASVTDLARFAAVLDRPLSGRAELTADGRVGPPNGELWGFSWQVGQRSCGSASLRWTRSSPEIRRSRAAHREARPGSDSMRSRSRTGRSPPSFPARSAHRTSTLPFQPAWPISPLCRRGRRAGQT